MKESWLHFGTLSVAYLDSKFNWLKFLKKGSKNRLYNLVK